VLDRGADVGDSDPTANRGATTLVCFVHDPDVLLVNPFGLVDSFLRHTSNFGQDAQLRLYHGGHRPGPRGGQVGRGGSGGSDAVVGAGGGRLKT
jgi:hypothetical protein